jgi:tetratricopeptide (TPR) repeat protein
MGSVTVKAEKILRDCSDNIISDTSGADKRNASRPVETHDAAHQLGAKLYHEGRFGEAVDAFSEAVRLAPREARYRISLAAVLGRLGRHNEAVSELTRALVNGGGRLPELHNNLGASLQKLRRLDEAAVAFRNAVSIKHDYVDAHRNLAGVLRQLGRPVAASAEYDAILAIRPSDPDALWGLAAALADAGDATRAIEVGRELVAANPNSAIALSSLLYTLHYSPDCSAVNY